MDAEPTAQGLVDEGRVAFRLANPARLYERPDAASAVIAELPAGSLLTVREDAGEFLHVIAPDDRFGYIEDATPVTPMHWDPGPRPTPAPPLETPVPVPAREALMGASQATGPTMAAVGAARSADDGPSFTRARPLTPSERVLVYDRISANRRSTLMLLAGFVLFVGAFFGALGVIANYYFSTTGEFDADVSVRIAIAAGIIALAVGILMYFSATAAVLSISGAREVDREDEPQLYRIVENLSIGSGLPMPRVWVIEDSAPNAFATGRNPGNAHVAATRGLLDKLEKRELEAVMAHEMSHVGNYDIRLMTTIAVVVGLTALVADLVMRFTWYGTGGRSSNRSKGGGGLGMIILVVALIFVIVSPIIATIMRLALSRQREYLADASGALLCRNPAALADALQKISADTEPLEVANKATAHLYIANPLKGHESFLNNLFATHPPVEERIRLLRAMG
jgi:heat shock protein HtpX